MAGPEDATHEGVSDATGKRKKKLGRPVDSTVDWDKIEAQYRAGTVSLRSIAEEHGVTEAGIRKRAKRDGWERDLTHKVNEKVRNALVRMEVREQGAANRAATEKETVEAAAATQVAIVLGHRKDIRKVRGLADTLLEQLTLAAGSREIFQEAIEEMTAADKTAARYNALMRAVALPTHIVAVKDLSQTMRHLVGLERQAFGLEEVEDPTPPGANDVKTPAQIAIDEARAKLKLRHAPDA